MAYLPKVRDSIAKSIKDADKTYFFEDYTDQADQVLAKLKVAGYQIVPLEPNDQMMQAGKEAISYGTSTPTDLVKSIYIGMVKAFQ